MQSQKTYSEILKLHFSRAANDIKAKEGKQIMLNHVVH